MKPKIAVYGAGTQGHTIAADLTLAGYEVNLLELPESKERIAGIQGLGGIHLNGKKHALVSGKSGFAKPNMVTLDAKKALEDVDVIFVDVPVADYENRIRAIAQYLKHGQIMNFTGYGYWACLRVANILKRMGKEDVILSESLAPIHWAKGQDGHAVSTMIRRRVPLAVFPSKRTKEALNVLKSVFPTFDIAKNVLQTNLENINMLIHPSITLLNTGAIDRADAKDEKFNFYVTGNTVHAEILAEAYDSQRMAVCQAYGVPYTSLREHIIRMYGSKGKTVQEVILNCKPYQDPGWQIDFNFLFNYMALGDIPFAMVPFVLLADLAGISTPIASAFIEIFGAFHIDARARKAGLTLDKLGLTGLSTEEVIEYVTDGEKK